MHRDIVPCFSKNKIGSVIYFCINSAFVLGKEISSGPVSSFLLDLSAPRICKKKFARRRTTSVSDTWCQLSSVSLRPGTRDTANKAMLFPIYQLSCLSDTLTYTWLVLTPGWLPNILRTSSDNPSAAIYFFLSVTRPWSVFISVFRRPSPDRPVWCSRGKLRNLK